MENYIMNNQKRQQLLAFLIVIMSGILLIFACSKNKENPLVGPVDDMTPPSKITTLNTASVGDGEIHLIWSPNVENDLAGYRLYRTENEDSLQNYILIYDSTQTSYKDINLDYTTTYFYRISAYDLSGNESILSDPVWRTPFNVSPPDIPQNLSVNAQNIGAPIIEISWDANSESDVRGYKIFRGTEYNFPASEIALLDSTVNNFYTDTNVFIDTVYYYKLSAYDKGGEESTPSAPDWDAALSPPTLLSPIDNEIVSYPPDFSWSAVNNAVQYKVFVQTSSVGDEIWSMTVDNTQTTLEYSGATVLESGTTYYWKVATITKPTALNSFSNIESFRIQ